jgi:hypothetical protein
VWKRGSRRRENDYWAAYFIKFKPVLGQQWRTDRPSGIEIRHRF